MADLLKMTDAPVPDFEKFIGWTFQVEHERAGKVYLSAVTDAAGKSVSGSAPGSGIHVRDRSCFERVEERSSSRSKRTRARKRA